MTRRIYRRKSNYFRFPVRTVHALFLAHKFNVQLAGFEINGVAEYYDHESKKNFNVITLTPAAVAAGILRVRKK
jgi:hypothetical protein